jgi:choice-of-anchor C domain-containing protein
MRFFYVCFIYKEIYIMKNTIGFLSVLLLGAAVSVQAAPFANGGFDDNPANNIEFDEIRVGNTKIFPWKVTKGHVDLIRNHWKNHSGQSSIDLLGTGIREGEISQTFDTVPGRKYTVKFMLSANPNGEKNILKIVNIFVENSNLKESLKFTYDSAKNGNSANDMKWQEHSFDFIATEKNATLIFNASVAGNTVSNFGPVIDSVSVVSNCDSETCCTCYPCAK